MLDWLDKVVKVAGALAVLGYIALRAHFNLLGLSTVSTLPLQLYLQETYRIANYLVVMVTPALAVCLVVFSVLAAVCKNATWASKITARLIAIGTGYFAPALLVTILFAMFLKTLRILSGGSIDLAVGLLKAPRTDRSTGEEWCEHLCILCFLAAVLVIWALKRSPKIPIGERRSWTGAAIMLGLVTLQIPILYGYYAAPLDYPVALVTSDEPAHTKSCGVLVLSTDSDLYLWAEESRSGKILQVSRSHIQSVATGARTDLSEFLENPKNTPDSAFPVCDMLNKLEPSK